MKYKSCVSLEYLYFMLHGRLDGRGNYARFCCFSDDEMLCVDLCESPEETLQNFITRRNNIVEESINFAKEGIDPPPNERKFTAVCSGCPDFVEREWRRFGRAKNLIHYISFAMGPSPCQSKCIYCCQRLDERRTYDKNEDMDQYRLTFDTVDYAQKNGFLAKSPLYDVAMGEITVHPLRQRVFDIIGDNTTCWLTNCIKFDENIGANLKANPQSNILTSIDAGTPGTWKEVKGVDNFETVCDNLVKYYEAANTPDQVTLKVIILPGLNDNAEDFNMIIEIAKALNAKQMV
ncbi:MAG: radical SAM protein, partial [Defluviitaleaceae bacterium]|nr:radical SAM protein [Defluviitaleaceae bacterium]